MRRSRPRCERFAAKLGVAATRIALAVRDTGPRVRTTSISTPWDAPNGERYRRRVRTHPARTVDRDPRAQRLPELQPGRLVARARATDWLAPLVRQSVSEL